VPVRLVVTLVEVDVPSTTSCTDAAQLALVVPANEQDSEIVALAEFPRTLVAVTTKKLYKLGPSISVATYVC
jgi:hypothetical protein